MHEYASTSELFTFVLFTLSLEVVGRKDFTAEFYHLNEENPIFARYFHIFDVK